MKEEVRRVDFLKSKLTGFEEVATIYGTTDYSQFKTFKSNRLPDHVSKIKANIVKNGYIANPLLVAKDNISDGFVIIDGNNRFNALKELNLPVYFCVLDGATENDIIVLNVVSKNWTAMNYIRCYASRGYEDYKKLLELYEEYSDLTLSGIILAMQYSLARPNKEKELTGGILERGLFKIKDEKKGREVLDFCMKVKNIPTHNKKTDGTVFRHRAFVGAVVKLMRDCEDFNADEVLNALDAERDMIKKQISVYEYAKMMETMVNNQRKSKRKPVHFDL